MHFWLCKGNASKQRLVCGRGPMKLISPLIIFRSWGNSFILVDRRNLPIGKIRGSFFRVIVPTPMDGLSLSIVANLMRSKGFPPRPTRCCLKKISPSPVKRRRIIIGRNTGSRKIRARTAKKGQQSATKLHPLIKISTKFEVIKVFNHLTKQIDQIAFCPALAALQPMQF